MTMLDTRAVSAVLDREHTAAAAQRAERRAVRTGTGPVDFRTSHRHRTASLAA